LPNKAGVLIVWPLFAWAPERQREVRAITLLREVMADRVRRIVREKFGQTYTPEVSYLTERGGDDGSLMVAIETHPDTVQQVIGEVRAIARSLSHGDVSPEELERVRKPLLDDTAHRRETAGWWLNTLDGSFRDPYKLAQARTWQADYSSIPVTEVNTVARRWLSREPLIAQALPDALPSATQRVATTGAGQSSGTGIDATQRQETPDRP
jgi:predicted Zn-dependent peptidase